MVVALFTASAPSGVASLPDLDVMTSASSRIGAGISVASLVSAVC